MKPDFEPAAVPLRPASLLQRHPLRLTLLAIVLLWCVLVFGLPSDGWLSRLVMVWGRFPLLLYGLWSVFQVTRLPQLEARTRRAWWLLGAAFSSIAVGDLVWGWLTVIRGENATFSIANVFYLGYFPLVLAGLLVWPRVFRSRGDALTFTLDAATVAVGIGMLIWYLALRPALGEATGGPWQRTVIALAFPIGDMLTVLGIALILLRQPLDSGRRVTRWLAIALLCSLIGDTLWILGKVLGLASTLGGSHLLWLLQTVALVAAARTELLRRRQAGVPLPDSLEWRDRFQALPIAAGVLGFVLLAVVARNGESAAINGAFLAATVLLLLVIARHLLGQRETAALLAENIRQRGESRFAALIEHASEAILIVDAQGAVNYASPATGKLLGAATQTAGSPLQRSVHPQDLAAFEDYLEGCRRGHVREARLVLRFALPGGGWATTETTLSNLLNDPKVAGIVLNVRDVSDRHALEEQLRFEALHDPLSGLANRELFHDRVSRALWRAQQTRSAIAVAILGLDRLKLINDGLGRGIGDQVLAATAERLQSALSGNDSLARLGGDEYAVLFETGVDPSNIAERMEQLRSLVSQPLQLDGQSVRTTTSVGYVLSHADAEIDTDTLLRNADIALHQAKTEGGARCCSFQAERHSQMIERLTLESALPQLLASEAFTLKFQPILRLGDLRPAGLRVALDWRERSHLPGSIAQVLAAARSAGLNDLTGRWMLAAVQRDLGALLRYVPDAARLWLQVPLDSALLDDPGLPLEIGKWLKKMDIPAANLVFELDSASLSPEPTAHAGLHGLKQMGVSLALTGFGGADRSLAALDLMPLNLLQLSGALGQLADHGHQALRAALAIGQALDLRVVVSEVDRPEQIAQLYQLGAVYGIGEALLPPLAYERALTWLVASFADANG